MSVLDRLESVVASVDADLFRKLVDAPRSRKLSEASGYNANDPHDTWNYEQFLKKSDGTPDDKVIRAFFIKNKGKINVDHDTADDGSYVNVDIESGFMKLKFGMYIVDGKIESVMATIDTLKDDDLEIPVSEDKLIKLLKSYK